MTSTPLKEDHLPNRPIPLIKVISTHNHEVPLADMKERSFRLHREIALINRHARPSIWYTCTHSHGDAGWATSGWGLAPGFRCVARL